MHLLSCMILRHSIFPSVLPKSLDHHPYGSLNYKNYHRYLIMSSPPEKFTSHSIEFTWRLYWPFSFQPFKLTQFGNSIKQEIWRFTRQSSKVSITSPPKDFWRGLVHQRREFLQSFINVSTLYSSSSSGGWGGQSKRSRSVENVEWSFRRYHSRTSKNTIGELIKSVKNAAAKGGLLKVLVS